MRDAQRREELRAQVRVSMGEASQLRDLLTNPDTKQRVDAVRTRLAEVEAYFLDEHHDRTPEQEALWLGTAERALRWHLDDLRYYQAAEAEFGPAVRLS